MPDQVSATANEWNVLLVEDDPETCRQIKEFFSDELFDSRKLAFHEIREWEKAFKLIRERKADLVILDIYRGPATVGGERIGEHVLKRIVETGFVSVVIHTNLPEGLQTLTNQFVRLVPKTDGLAKLKEQILDLFEMHIPQMHRAIINHLDSTLRDYMWKFVQPNWEQFKPIANRPEFLRLIVQRLALTLAREGIEQMTEEVFGAGAVPAVTDPENVHPAEYYIKPSLGTDPLLGDIRVRRTDGNLEYLVVLWPSCDMVSTRKRFPKTERVLCARSTPLQVVGQLADWLSNPPSKGKKDNIRKMIQNATTPPGREGPPDRYHYLPGVWDIPHLVVDFQALEHLELSTVRGFSCVATLASPFAEALATRFGRYLGRPGTPDLDVDGIIKQLRLKAVGIPEGASNAL